VENVGELRLGIALPTGNMPYLPPPGRKEAGSSREGFSERGFWYLRRAKSTLTVRKIPFKKTLY
jgi:hypothetical protein